MNWNKLSKAKVPDSEYPEVGEPVVDPSLDKPGEREEPVEKLGDEPDLIDFREHVLERLLEIADQIDATNDQLADLTEEVKNLRHDLSDSKNGMGPTNQRIQDVAEEIMNLRHDVRGAVEWMKGRAGEKAVTLAKIFEKEEQEKVEAAAKRKKAKGKR